MDISEKLTPDQIRVLHCLLDGPLWGIRSHKERGGVWAILTEVEGLSRRVMGRPITTEKGRELAKHRLETRAGNTIVKLRNRGCLVTHWCAVKGEKYAGAKVEITDKGRELLELNMNAILNPQPKKKAVKKAPKRYVWTRGLEPEMRWERWYTTKHGWRALVEYYPPEDAWRIKLIKPSGEESTWGKPKGQTLARAKRAAEATLEKYLRKQ